LAVGAVFTATDNSFMAALLTLAAGPLVGMVFVYERPDDVKVVIVNETVDK
jgi:ACS family glucarate transporter-like MFS transporter